MPLNIYGVLEDRKVEVSFRKHGAHILLNVSNGKRGVNFTHGMAIKLRDELDDALLNWPPATKRVLRVVR